MAADKIVELVVALEKASGLSGMAGGQMLDLQNEGKHISLEALQQLHSLKTGALLLFAVQAPIILFQPAPSVTKGVTRICPGDRLSFSNKR